MAVRDPRLHAALRAFAEEAAWTLAAETAAGAELGFDLLEERRRGGPVLYCYRADTTGFIASRRDLLGRLETRPPAAALLAGQGGLEDYLRSRGHARIPLSGRERADAALDALLERIFEDATEFVLSEERLERALDELDALLGAGGAAVEVVVPLLGLAIGSDALVLGEGLTLARPDGRVPEEAAWDGARETVLAVVEGDHEGVVAEAPARMRRLVSALRLYDSPRPAMGPAAWVRTAGGPWQVAPTGSAGRAGGLLEVTPEQEDELRAFCNLVWRRLPRGGPVAWALARFDMGCERPAGQRLTDHLLALRALLGADESRLAERLAALCAEPAERSALGGEVDRALALERALVAGRGVAAGDVEPVAAAVAGHLRAVLRDVLCGHLDPDLPRVADALLAGGEGAGAGAVAAPA